MNKYGAIASYSELCQRGFDSKAEMRRAEELCLLEKAREIWALEYQPRYVLCFKPKITYTADFRYRSRETPNPIVEDVKGMLTRETRVKLAWLKEKYGIEVRLVK
jgi:hypothetical protein